MPRRSEERAEFLWDIVTTAIEGGTGYWACVHAYKWVDLPASERYAVIEEDLERIGVDEGEAPGHHRLDIDVIATGLARVLDPRFRVNDQIRGWIKDSDRDNYAGMIDADCADVIVQAAIFGELVYG